MKRTIKILSVCALLGILMTLLCGCDMLDELKNSHAVLSPDKETVVFRGETLVRLPDGIPYYFNDTYSNTCYTTEEDFPLLLIKEFGRESYYDSLSGILAVMAEDDIVNVGIDYYDSYYSKVSSVYRSPEYMYFCNKENFEKYTSLTPDDADRIGYYTYTKDYNTGILSSSTSKEILDFLKSDVIDEDSYIKATTGEYYDSLSPIYMCNKELTLRQVIEYVDIAYTSDDRVYVVDHNKGTAQLLSEKAANELSEVYYGDINSGYLEVLI